MPVLRASGRLIGLWLFVGTWALYWPARTCGFVYDDLKFLVAEPALRLGLTPDGLRWACTSFHAANWYPLTLLSHLLDFQCFGFSPAGHHLVNVGLHALNSLLLFILLQRLTGALLRSALVAALFAVHPLHVESVAWISERKGLLCTLLWILGTGAYLGYLRRRSGPRYLLLVLLAALALLAKPMAVSFPCALLLLDFWPLGRLSTAPVIRQQGRLPAGWTRLVGEKLPLFALAAAGCVTTFVAQRRGGAVAALDVYPFSLRLGNAAISYVRYLFKTLWPRDLAALYPFPLHGLSAPEVIGAVAALLIASAACLRFARRWPAVATGWYWYLGTLVPVIGVIQVGQQALADRYSYIPHIGLFIAVVWGAHGLVQGSRAPWRVLAGALALVAVPLLFVVARNQIAVWQNNKALFEQMVQVDPRNWVAQTELGLILTEEGRVSEGIERYRLSLKANPGYAYTPFNLAVALVTLGRMQEAADLFGMALRSDPGFAEAWHYRGIVLARLGGFAQAVPCFAEAVRLQPQNAGFLADLQRARDELQASGTGRH